MATVERRHREAAVQLMQTCAAAGHGFPDEDKLRLSLMHTAQALADAEATNAPADDRVAWLETNIADGIGDLFWLHEDEDPDLETLLPRMRDELQCLFRCERELAELKAPSSAPVTGDRLLASLACHIDHDEPPGLAARELATTVLELLDGADGVEAVILAAKLRGLIEQRKVGERG
jgi:hypothetical protein